jgi:hypothetical protein
MLRIKSAYALTAVLLLAGCQANVTHPTKTLAEQQVDIDACTKWANDKYWMDPVAALLNAYDCLGAKGYRKGNAGVEAKVEQGMKRHASTRAPAEPPLPCRVPCKPEPR